DGISLIASFIGKHVMLDLYTSFMCNDLWGRSSFAWCLIEVNSEADLVDCPKKVVGPPIVSTSNVVTPTTEKNNDGFQKSVSWPFGQTNLRYEPKAATSEPKKGATNVGNTSKSSSMMKSTGNSSKKGNITTSNSYSALENDEEEDEEHVENVYDESANLFPNSKPNESSTFVVVVG
nr:hypothetical protein [Tanacetum cinerariifolium]